MLRSIIATSLLISFLLLFAGAADCGVIKTTITSWHTVVGPGQIDLRAEIENEGDAAAYKVGATIFMGDWSNRFDNLGDLLPGGTLQFADKYADPEFKPGSYSIVFRVDYEESGGLRHIVYHFSNLTYLPENNELPPAKLTVSIEPPRFNPKVFWGRTDRIKLILKNENPTPVKALIDLYLPDGFSTEKPAGQLTLAPGETKSETFSVAAKDLNYSGRPFHLVVRHEIDGRHYTEKITGNFIVEEKSLYLKLYLAGGGLCLVLIFLLSIRKKKSS